MSTKPLLSDANCPVAIVILLPYKCAHPGTKNCRVVKLIIFVEIYFSMPEINIGAQVCLKSYSETKEGKVNHVNSPIMLVTEISKNREGSKFNDLTGIELNNGINYKCLWFHQKRQEFKEEWFDGIQIEIKGQEKEIPNLTFDRIKEKKQIGFKVCLAVNNPFSFKSPSMTLIDVIINKDKIEYERQTKQNLRIMPEYLAKCKWYNSKENKFSERLFPLEVLKYE